MAELGHASAQLIPGMVPSWVPEAAIRYLAHTEDGHSIRALARLGGCHASTVLRQIRRVENRRDDVLVDEALRGLGRLVAETEADPDFGSQQQEADAMSIQHRFDDDTLPDAATLRREARRILRRLCEPGAVLAVALDMDKAVVVRDLPGGGSDRLAVLDRTVAQALALKDWIACAAPGRVSRYTITGAGRSELNRLLVMNPAATAPEDGPDKAGGFVHISDALTGQRQGQETAETSEGNRQRRSRYSPPDSPVAMLARRRSRDGAPFLDEAMVTAATRLAEDFELAQMGPQTTQNWDRFLTSGANPAASGDTGPLRGGAAARARVAAALRDLGPGLGDVALRCCCYQQGLETAEKKMGWSARSGKIVLRIALQRLRLHYDQQGPESGLIG